MARDLERYFDELERRVTQLERDCDDRRCRATTLRKAMASFDAYADLAINSSFYGLSVGHFNRDELLALIGWLSERMKAHGISW